MSYLFTECEEGSGGVYVVRRFSADFGGTEFLPGQRVKYLGRHDDPERGPMVKFEFDRVVYTAAANLFVSEQTWAGLMKVFGDEVKRNQPAADNNSTSQLPGWLMTVGIIMVVSFGLWIAIGVMAALSGK